MTTTSIAVYVFITQPGYVYLYTIFHSEDTTISSQPMMSLYQQIYIFNFGFTLTLPKARPLFIVLGLHRAIFFPFVWKRHGFEAEADTADGPTEVALLLIFCTIMRRMDATMRCIWHLSQIVEGREKVALPCNLVTDSNGCTLPVGARYHTVLKSWLQAIWFLTKSRLYIVSLSVFPTCPSDWCGKQISFHSFIWINGVPWCYLCNQFFFVNLKLKTKQR